MNNDLERVKGLSNIFNECKSKKDVFDVLEAQNEVKKELVDTNRWWDEKSIVVSTPDNKYIRYVDAFSTGDESPMELGYDGAKLSDVIEVYPKVIETVIYVEKKED